MMASIIPAEFETFGKYFDEHIEGIPGIPCLN